MTSQYCEYGIRLVEHQTNEQTLQKIQKDIIDYLKESWENAGDFIYTTLKEQTDALFEDIGKSWDKTTGSWGDTAGEAISGSLSAIFSGEMDDLDEIWDNAWDEMGEQAYCPLSKARAFTPPVPLRSAA